MEEIIKLIEELVELDEMIISALTVESSDNRRSVARQAERALSKIKSEIASTRGEKPARRQSRTSAYDRTRAQVYATGNKWQIENFEATH